MSIDANGGGGSQEAANLITWPRPGPLTYPIGRLVRPPVVELLFKRSPAAVAGAVRAVIVNTVEAEPLWSRAHVSQEIAKGVPAKVNGDTTSAVVLVVAGIGVEATGTHALPNPVLTCADATVLNVSAMRRGEEVGYPYTAAIKGPISPEGCTSHSALGAAITLASPRNQMALLTVLRKDSPFPESLTDEVNLRGHLGTFLRGVMGSGAVTPRPHHYTRDRYRMLMWL